MKDEKLSVKAYFARVLEERKVSEQTCPGADFCDWQENLAVLLENYEETVAFLKEATVEEIACAVDVLEELVLELPKEAAQVIVDIFKRKQAEYPDVQQYAATEYALELKIAQEIIDDKG